jgi:hypothetical protein
MRNILLAFLLFNFCTALGQTDTFSVEGFDFCITSEVIENDWQTFDTVNRLYRIEEGQKKYLLKFFPYKDDGADCNNRFWHKEYLEVKNGCLIFGTDYYQWTNMDPIPVKRKQMYTVLDNGKLILTYDKYKYMQVP